MADRVNEVLSEHEAASGAARLQPGELLVEIDGVTKPIPLLTPQWSQKLAGGFKVSAVRRHLEYEQLQVCLELEEDFDLEQLWRWTDQKELVGRRGGKEFLPAEPLDVETLEVSPRPLEDIAFPDAVLEPVISYLTQEYGCKPALARAMAERAAQIRQWCCPGVKELKPGQVVWLVYSTRRSKRGQGNMGRTLTHKTIVVEMSLEGLSTQQIARRIFHTPEAVDNYLRLFDRVLVLRYFGMPPHLMRQVMGHSMALIKEHLLLADKHFPSEKDLVDYLANRGVELEKAQ